MSVKELSSLSFNIKSSYKHVYSYVILPTPWWIVSSLSLFLLNVIRPSVTPKQMIRTWLSLIMHPRDNLEKALNKILYCSQYYVHGLIGPSHIKLEWKTRLDGTELFVLITSRRMQQKYNTYLILGKSWRSNFFHGNRTFQWVFEISGIH